ncbi:MAG TPA: sialidase family protein [Verrucomicrobiae bacterium]|nr:sialidase family protein [Verrucomicrobiae bacterium]
MKRCNLFDWWRVLPLFLLAFLLPASNPLWAQGTAFNYQGRLLVNSNAPTGNYDMQFKLHPTATSTNQVGSTLTLSPIGVTNGLFFVTLDFGNVYNGTLLYLEIGVRPTGTLSNYTILSPTQPLNPTPYSVYSENSAAFTGAISDSQLSTNVPLFDTGGKFSGPVVFSNASGNFNGALSGTFNGAATGTFTGTATGNFNGTNTGTFIGNGAGVTNVNVTNIVGVVQSNPNWQVMQSTSQTAVSGNNYIATNNALTTLTLPGSPGVGSVVRLSGSGANGWKAAPNTGQAINTAILGLSAGQVWTQEGTSQTWHALTSSANGMRLAAGIGSGTGTIYYSGDGGMTWNPSDAPAKNWAGIACSADGMRMVAVPNGGNAYTSINAGTNWVAQSASSNVFYTCVASSADGINLAAAVGSGTGPVYTSSNGGTNWMTRSVTSQNWTGIACSSNGTKIVAVPSGLAQIYVSSDSGVTWTNRGPANSWSCAASSADGNKLVAAISTGNIYTSGDGGVTWTARATSQAWKGVASSADGVNLAAVYSTGFIYTSSDSGRTWLQRTNGVPSGAQAWSCITSSASGSRLVAAINGGSFDFLYLSVAQTTPLTGSLSGTQYSDIELQYIGNGQWMPLTFNGSFTGY